MATSEKSELQKYVNYYKSVLQNTQAYREAWKNGLREFIRGELEKLVVKTQLDAEVKLRDRVSNLEAIELTLGRKESGLSQRVNENIRRALIKYNGALIYQQLFNGKVIVLIHYPYIEGYVQPRTPRTLTINRPSELKKEHIEQHLEEFLKDITRWEDIDGDEPHNKIGFQLNFSDNQEGETIE